MTSKLKTIAVVEMRWLGHHPSWFYIFCSELLKLGLKVHGFCPCPEDVFAHFGKNNKNLHCFAIEDKSLKQKFLRKIPALRNRLMMSHLLYDIKKIFHKKKIQLPDFFFFPCLANGDFFPIKTMDKIMPKNWSGLYVDCTPLRNNFIKRILKHRTFDPLAIFKARKCSALICLEEDFSKKIKKKLPSKKIFICPDFADETEANPDFYLIKKIKKFAKNKKLFAMLGALNKNKGLLEFLKAAQENKNPDFCFACIGQLIKTGFSHKEIKQIEQISARSTNKILTCFERLPSEAEFNAVLEKIDCLVLPYKNFSRSSNSPAKASIYQIPIISSAKGCLAKRIKNFNLGLTIPDNSSKNLNESFDKIFSINNFNFKKYHHTHSIKKVKPLLKKMLKIN